MSTNKNSGVAELSYEFRTGGLQTAPPTGTSARESYCIQQRQNSKVLRN